MSGSRVLVVGATGLVGREILSLLVERRFPVGELYLFASERSEGDELEVGDEVVRVRRLPPELPPADVVFLCASPEISRDLAEDAADAGALVIDLTGAWQDDPGVPRAWAGRALSAATGGLLVATPGSLALLLAALVRPVMAFGLRRVVATALVSASSSGNESVGALARASAGLLGGTAFEEEEGTVGDARRAFNVVPVADAAATGGRVIREVREILDVGTEVPFHLHVVRIPTFHGQGVTLSVELGATVDVAALEETLRQAPSIVFGGDVGTRDAVGSDAVHLSVPRVDPADPCWFHAWAASDNLRQGSALNAVAIAESRLPGRPGRG